MNVEELVKFAEAAISSQAGASLSSLQRLVLRECCQDQRKTYDRIALDSGYSGSYLKKKVIPQLWHLLSETFGQKVTKANCYLILEQSRESIAKTRARQVKLESPEGPVPLASPFYIERPELEQSLYEEILEPGALIRIKGSAKIGKTTLLARTLASAEKQHYHTIRLNLNRAGSSVLKSPDRFFRWFCANATRQLGLEYRLEEYWNEDFGVLTNCCLYFEKYLLEQIEQPLVLGLDEVNRLLEHPAFARDFFAWVQSWHEEAKDCPLRQKLRILACYSTDAGIRLDRGKSPWNVGLVLELPPFTPLQVRDLAQRHRLPLSSGEFAQLHSLLGGFPYLTRKLFYQAARYEVELNELVATAASDTGIFSDHLQERLQVLHDKPDLLAAYRQVVTAQTPIALEQKQAFQLKNLGLVRLDKSRATASCQLYLQYFREQLE